MPQHLSAYINIYKIAMNWPLYYKRYFFFHINLCKIEGSNVLRKRASIQKQNLPENPFWARFGVKKNPEDSLNFHY